MAKNGSTCLATQITSFNIGNLADIVRSGCNADVKNRLVTIGESTTSNLWIFIVWVLLFR